MKRFLFLGMGLALFLLAPGAAGAQEADTAVLAQGLTVLDQTLEVVAARTATMTPEEKAQVAAQLAVIEATLRTMDSTLAQAGGQPTQVASPVPTAPRPLVQAPAPAPQPQSGVPLSISVEPSPIAQAPEAPVAPEAPAAPAASQAAQASGFGQNLRQWIGPLIFILFAAAVLMFLLSQPGAKGQPETSPNLPEAKPEEKSSAPRAPVSESRAGPPPASS